MVYAFILGILIFLSGWGIVFIVSATRAPAALDAQSQSTIAGLNEKLELPDKVQAEHLKQLLANVGENGKALVKFMLLYEHEIGWGQIRVPNLSDKEASEAMNACRDQGLIVGRREQHPTHAAISNSYFSIPDGFRPTLKRVLLIS